MVAASARTSDTTVRGYTQAAEHALTENVGLGIDARWQRVCFTMSKRRAGMVDMGPREQQTKSTAANAPRPVGMQTMSPDLYQLIRQAVVELAVGAAR